jgi:hypothetical protein
VMNAAVVIGALTAVAGSILVSIDTDELVRMFEFPPALAAFLAYRLAGG